MYTVCLRHCEPKSGAVYLVKCAGPFKKLERAMQFVGGRNTVICDATDTILYKWRVGGWKLKQ